MANARNPVYDCPDAHELAGMKALASSPHHFHLVPSTRAQRRWRAWYRRQRAAAIAARGSAVTAAPGDAAGNAAPVEATRQDVSAML